MKDQMQNREKLKHLCENICEGNIGAISCMNDVFDFLSNDFIIASAVIKMLECANIRGSKIWDLWTLDNVNKDPALFLAKLQTISLLHIPKDLNPNP